MSDNSEKFRRDMKVAEIFSSEEFLKDGSFAEMINDPAIKKACDELLFELVKQDVNKLPGSIKTLVEDVVCLIKENAYRLAENL